MKNILHSYFSQALSLCLNPICFHSVLHHTFPLTAGYFYL
jgi:hypothetical protein